MVTIQRPSRALFRFSGPDAPKLLFDVLTPRILPELPVIRTSADWQQALDSALGPALKRAWEAEA